MSSKAEGRKIVMKRRIIIFGGAVALYSVLMAVSWVVGTRQAERKTEALLSYAVSDMRISLDGVIDTLLEHLASVAVRHFGKPAAYPMSEVSAVAKAFDIDELCIVDRTGRILATNDPASRGVDMNAKDETRPFAALTNGVTQVVSQPFRRHAYSNSRRKYLGVPFPNGDGYIQIGLDEARMVRMISSQLSFLFDSCLQETVCYLCADLQTGTLVSMEFAGGKAPTLAEIGFDESKMPRRDGPLPDMGGGEADETFEQTLFGRRVFCRSFVFGGHLFIMSEPEDEFFGTRNIIVATMAILMVFVLGGFAFFMDRIFLDSDQLKAFYAAEAKSRAKDMEIAKTIQTSALPLPLPDSPYYRIYASMQAAKDVGGDFYDYFHLDATHVAFLVADVSGKGVTAAFYMMTAKAIIKEALLSARDPAVALTKANTELCANNNANMFITAWVGVLDLETGIVEFANAGHNQPVKIETRGDESGQADNRLSSISEKSGPVIAFMDGIVYEGRTVQLSQGDTLFLYTDGVTEALDSKNELFGEERLMDALKVAPSSEPHSMCMVVRAAVAAFSEGVPQADDITVLAVRYVAPPLMSVRSFSPTQAGIAAASAFLDECVGKLCRAKGGNPAGLQTSLSSLHIILDEVCSNIVKHSGASGFEIDVSSRNGKITMVFIDDGVPFDPLGHADPGIDIPIEERPIGGLGIMMVKKLASSVSYHRAHGRNLFVVELSC